MHAQSRQNQGISQKLAQMHFYILPSLDHYWPYMGAGYWPVQICYSHEVSQRQRQLTRPIPFSFSSNYHSTGPLVLHTIATTQPDIPRPALVLRTMLHGDLMWRYMQCTLYNSYTVTRSTPPTTIGCQLGSYTGYRLELFPIRSFYPPRQKLI